MTVAELASAMLVVMRRLEADRAAGRCTWSIPAGEPSIRGSASVYVAPVTGPQAEVPGRAPSARVVVAPRQTAEREAAGGTMPVDVKALRAVTQAAWYAPPGGWERRAKAEGMTAPLPRQTRSGDGRGIGDGSGDGYGSGYGSGHGRAVVETVRGERRGGHAR